MEQNQNSALFSLSIDPVTKANLGEAAKWARFLAIAGMIILVLGVIGIIFFITMMSGFGSTMGAEYGATPFPVAGGLGIGLAAVYIILLAIWFFPLLYLLRFANGMRAALVRNDQQALNVSFQNLKICLRFVGIVTIIILALYALVIVIGIAGTAAFS
ncbi:MAG: hypothetical protein ABR502_06900 [Chitinophagaceae bacterium]